MLFILTCLKDSPDSFNILDFGLFSLNATQSVSTYKVSHACTVFFDHQVLSLSNVMISQLYIVLNIRYIAESGSTTTAACMLLARMG